MSTPGVTDEAEEPGKGEGRGPVGYTQWLGLSSKKGVTWLKQSHSLSAGGGIEGSGLEAGRPVRRPLLWAW